MFKRGSSESAPPAKGGPGSQAEEKKDPVPRHIPLNSVTLNFVQRGWTEIAPGNLYYLAVCSTPKLIFDDANKNLFNKFKSLYYTMEIHNPEVEISNLIFLQDDLRVQNNTPTDATAFTQVNYLQKTCPKGKKQYFCLGTGKDVTEFNKLTYKLEVDKPHVPFVQVKGFDNFQDLMILPAKANLQAGFKPGGAVNANPNTGEIQDIYVAPNTSTNAFAGVSGNLAPGNMTDLFYKQANVITRMANQDSIHFYKYGDVIKETINTNLEGVHLANVEENNFLTDTYVVMPNPAKPTQKLNYLTEWAYPSRNRPFLSRDDYYSGNLNAIMKGKKFKPLSHCFFSMPPIRKPGGELLGQRCSVFVEQQMQVTFNFSTGVFGSNEDDALQQEQDDQVVIRRNFYPIPNVDAPPQPSDENSVFCKKGTAQCKSFSQIKKQKMKAQKCYDNTFDGLIEFLDDILIHKEFGDLITFSSTRPGPCPTDVQVASYVRPSSFKSGGLPKIWETWIEGKNYTWLCFKVPSPELRPDPNQPGVQNWVYWVNSKNEPLVYQQYSEGTTPPMYMHLHKEKFLEYFWARGKTFCNVTDKEEVSAADFKKDAYVFFT